MVLECQTKAIKVYGAHARKRMNFQVLFIAVLIVYHIITPVGLSGLRVTCSTPDPNPAEVEGFFQDVKILSTNSLGETSSGSRV